VRFKEQVWPGDELTCTGIVTKVEPTDESELVEVELNCTRQTGGVAIVGTASFLL
jgi:acyl dehydratase